MFRERTLRELSASTVDLSTRRVLLGFDGFVDTIVTPVGRRRGAGEQFDAIATIREFGERIAGAAGKSTNLELYPRLEKMGGNAPIMAGALVAAGARVTCVGALGKPVVHPVFAGLAAGARTLSLCEPARTTAVEFSDGKVMLGLMKTFDEITRDRLRATTEFDAELSAAEFVGLLNWTMLPGLTGILEDFLDRRLPALPRKARLFFFDLADPEKRAQADLQVALRLISRFEEFGRVTLGLNFKEAQQVCGALGLTARGENETGLRRAAGDIRRALGIANVFIHLRTSAATATADDTWWVPASTAEMVRINTGAGDHFNAGVATGQLLGLSAEACLVLGVSTAGHYVRTAASPTLPEL
jgi:hypothetical protein